MVFFLHQTLKFNYNKIPLSIRDKPSHTEFKHDLNHLLIEKAYYTVNEFLLEYMVLFA